MKTVCVQATPLNYQWFCGLVKQELKKKNFTKQSETCLKKYCIGENLIPLDVYVLF